MEVLTFNAEDVCKISQVEPLPGAPTWADLEFKPKPSEAQELGGCGLYCVSFEGRAVYVGKFLGSIRGPFSGSVLEIRWLRHLPSMSLRGRRFSISRGPLQMLLKDLEPGELLDGLRGADSEFLMRDRGYLASYNRVRFASKHWTALRGDPAAFLGLFDFGYVRLEPTDTDGLNVDLINAVVSNAEVQARHQLQLCCNGEVDFESAWVRDSIRMDIALDALVGDLTQQLRSLGASEPQTPRRQASVRATPQLTPSVRHLPTARKQLEPDSAMESIEDDLPEGWPSELLLHLRTQAPTPALEVHATATQPRGDIRVRVLDTRRVRNVFTMKWRPQQGYFSCRILLLQNQIEGLIGVCNVRRVNDPLPTAFDFDAALDTQRAIKTLMDLIAQAATAWRGADR